MSIQKASGLTGGLGWEKEIPNSELGIALPPVPLARPGSDPFKSGFAVAAPRR
jgi:hypothetical protein